MKRRISTNSLRILGIGGAACAACCVGPILGFLAAAGVFTVAGAATFGAVGPLAPSLACCLHSGVELNVIRMLIVQQQQEQPSIADP